MDKKYLNFILRTLFFLLITMLLMPTATMANMTYFGKIPATGYVKSCSLCHTTAPALNAFGTKFKAAGYDFSKLTTTTTTSVVSPSAYPMSGTYGRYVWLYLQHPDTGAVIRYTLNGHDPRLEGNSYTKGNAIGLDPLDYPNGRITVKAVAQIGEQFSAIATFNYNIQVIDVRNAIEAIPEGYPYGTKISFESLNLAPNQAVNVKIGKWVGDINTDPSGWNSINWNPVWSATGVVSSDGKWVNVILPFGIPAGNYFAEFTWVDPQGQTAKIVWWHNSVKITNAKVTKIEVTPPVGKTNAEPGDSISLKIIGENLSAVLLTIESGTWPYQQRHRIYLSGGPMIINGQFILPIGTTGGTWKVVEMELIDLYGRNSIISDALLIPNATFSVINNDAIDFTPVVISSLETNFYSWLGIRVRASVISNDVGAINVSLVSPITQREFTLWLSPEGNGYYSAFSDIPDYLKLEEGQWTTKIIYSYDKAGNFVWPEKGLRSSYYNELLSRTAPVVIDYTPPVLNDYKLVLEADTKTGGWLLTIRAWATDALSRLNFAYLDFKPVRDDIYYPIAVNLNPVSEPQSDGANLTGTFNIPSTAPLGSWRFYKASIWDEHWNSAVYTDKFISLNGFSLARQWDFTGDGWVDINDVQTQSLAYGQKTDIQNTKFDLNSDGTIDLYDLVFLARRTIR